MTLYIETRDDPVRISAIIEDDDWHLLDRFLDYSQDLLESNLVQAGMPASLKISGRPGEPVTVESTLPPRDEFAAFLHLFRPLYLQSEPTNFPRVCGCLSRNFQNSIFRRMLGDLRDLCSGKYLQAMFRVSSDNVALNSDRTLYKYLNAYEYHRDETKRKEIDALHEMFPLDASKVIFLALLTEKVKAIAGLAALVNVVLGNENTLSTKIRADSI